MLAKRLHDVNFEETQSSVLFVDCSNSSHKLRHLKQKVMKVIVEWSASSLVILFLEMYT